MCALNAVGVGATIVPMQKKVRLLIHGLQTPEGEFRDRFQPIETNMRNRATLNWVRLFQVGMGSFILAAMSCSTNALLNTTSATSNLSVGLGIPVPRTISVGFINNTPFRAIFTFGAYDQLDESTVPQGFGQLRLEGNTSSAQIAQPCRKTFSVGGAELIRLIELNRNGPLITVNDPAALVQGVNFSGAALGDPLEAEPTEGTSLGTVLLAGVDFSCARTDIRQTTGTGVLIFTFEEDAAAPGGFRTDFTFVAP